MPNMTADHPRVAAVVEAGLQNAGVRLDAAELAQLKSQTAILLEGLDRLDELNIATDQVEPALSLDLAESKADE